MSSPASSLKRAPFPEPRAPRFPSSNWTFAGIGQLLVCQEHRPISSSVFSPLENFCFGSPELFEFGSSSADTLTSPATGPSTGQTRRCLIQKTSSEGTPRGQNIMGTSPFQRSVELSVVSDQLPISLTESSFGGLMLAGNSSLWLVSSSGLVRNTPLLKFGFDLGQGHFNLGPFSYAHLSPYAVKMNGAASFDFLAGQLQRTEQNRSSDLFSTSQDSIVPLSTEQFPAYPTTPDLSSVVVEAAILFDLELNGSKEAGIAAATDTYKEVVSRRATLGGGSRKDREWRRLDFSPDSIISGTRSSRRVFKRVEEQIQERLFQLNALDQLEDSGIFSEQERLLRISIKCELDRLWKMEEISWSQKAKETWLKLGDRNTRFFHRVANARKRHNNLDRILVNGIATQGQQELKTAAVRFFQDLYSDPISHRPFPQVSTLHLAEILHELRFRFLHGGYPSSDCSSSSVDSYCPISSSFCGAHLFSCFIAACTSGGSVSVAGGSYAAFFTSSISAVCSTLPGSTPPIFYRQITSWVSPNNPSPGNFTCGMELEGYQKNSSSDDLASEWIILFLKLSTLILGSSWISDYTKITNLPFRSEPSSSFTEATMGQIIKVIFSVLTGAEQVIKPVNQFRLIINVIFSTRFNDETMALIPMNCCNKISMIKGGKIDGVDENNYMF
ncbi:hypothetical protein LINPERPRIM_LOCUS41571 [Linum perenne]